MKKIYCCLTWAALTLALAACSNSQKPAEPATETKTTMEAPAPAAQEAAPPAEATTEQAAPAAEEAAPPAEAKTEEAAPAVELPPAPGAAPHN